jgi:hypothetical protein
MASSWTSTGAENWSTSPMTRPWLPGRPPPLPAHGPCGPWPGPAGSLEVSMITTLLAAARRSEIASAGKASALQW